MTQWKLKWSRKIRRNSFKNVPTCHSFVLTVSNVNFTCCWEWYIYEKMLSIASRQERRNSTQKSAWWRVRALYGESGLGSSLGLWPRSCRTWLWSLTHLEFCVFVKQVWCIKAPLSLDDIPGFRLDYVWNLEGLFKKLCQRGHFIFLN